jgi:hypothetical protein
MEREPEIDHAILTATARTIQAEDQVLDVLDEEAVPPVPLVSKVVRRAEDVHILAEQAAEDAHAEDAREEPAKTDMNAEGDGGQVYGG